MFKILFLAFSLLTGITACGGSSSTVSNEPFVTFVHPADNATFRAGENINFEIQTNNFVLHVPNTHADMTHEDTSEMHGHTHMHMRDHPGDSSHAQQEGHYHVYLNDAADADPHLTAWTSEATFELPHDITPGMHQLRLELRDNQHAALGIETFLAFEVIE